MKMGVILVKLNTTMLGCCYVVSNMLLYGCTLAQSLKNPTQGWISKSKIIFKLILFLSVKKNCKSDHLGAVLN